jgi:hypothetical protein
MIAVLAAIGGIALFLSVAKIMPKYLDGTTPNAALQDCEKLVRAHFQPVRMTAPTERHEGEYEVFKWTNIYVETPHKTGTAVRQTATCKFDLQHHRVVYLGFD